MTSNECVDCLPEVPVDKSVDIQKQAQPASAAETAKLPIPSTLAGPSSHNADGQKSTSNGRTAVEGQPISEEDIRPPSAVYPNMIIEFCDRCRWYVLSSHSQLSLTRRAPRATWIQTELFLTFPTPAIKSIALIPLNTPETGGRFRVWLDKGEGRSELLWDRKVCWSLFVGIKMAKLCGLKGYLSWQTVRVLR